jgi:heme exporter protein A
LPFSSPVLTADGLSKQFGRRVLFRGLDAAVGSGEALAITGPNGSGKSTLLLLLAGLLAPSAGRVQLSLGGVPVAPEEHTRRIGFVAPYLELYDDLTARENLVFLAHARGLSDADIRSEAVLARVGLGGREDDPIKTYSSGMKQRARFATALLADPPVLLLDEPGSNLDEVGREFVRSLVDSHRSKGGAVVLATNIGEEAELCDSRISLG